MYTQAEQQVISHALDIISSKLHRLPLTASSPKAVVDYSRIRFGNLDHEVFVVLHVDNQHQLIEIEELFRGTIDGAAVYPREVVKSAILKGAAGVVFVHNHPSGITEPSQADIAITRKLMDALSTVEIRVLDHLVISAQGYTSMRERGLL